MDRQIDIYMRHLILVYSPWPQANDSHENGVKLHDKSKKTTIQTHFYEKSFKLHDKSKKILYRSTSRKMGLNYMINQRKLLYRSTSMNIG